MSHFPSYCVSSCLSWWQICFQLLEETLGPWSCVFLAEEWSAGAFCITESKVILLSAQQTDKSRDKVFVFSNFIWKVRRPRRWWTRVPKNHHAQIRMQSSFIPKEEGVWLVVANFLMSEFFVFEPIHLGQVMMFFDCVDHNKLWKILKERRIADHLNCLLRNLYAGQEVTVRTGHGTTDWLQTGKGLHQGCILSPCLFNLYAEYIMRNAGLEEAQSGVKIPGRNINNLRYACDTTQKVKT